MNVCDIVNDKAGCKEAACTRRLGSDIPTLFKIYGHFWNEFLIPDNTQDSCALKAVGKHPDRTHNLSNKAVPTETPKNKKDDAILNCHSR